MIDYYSQATQTSDSVFHLFMPLQPNLLINNLSKYNVKKTANFCIKQKISVDAINPKTKDL